MNEELIVYLHGERCGTLARDGTRYGFTFVYDGQWIVRNGRARLSLSMPHERSAIFPYDQARAFFRGLLPEGRRREILAGRADPNDDFALLLALGEECAGAVVLTRGDLAGLGEPHAVEISEEEIMAAMRRNMPALARIAAVRRFSLAGVQPKETLYFDRHEDPAAAPLRKAAGSLLSTHIVKPTISDDFPGLAWNELFCMRVAGQIGLTVPQTWLREIDRQPCLIVERFDRTWNDDLPGQIHLEDACQALGAFEKYEYDDDGAKVGPGFPELSSLIDAMSVPALERRKLRTWAIFNLLIGNADAHGKNLAIIHGIDGGAEISPFYDLVCTALYRDLTRDLAMAIGTGRQPHVLQGTDFEEWAHDMAIRPSAVVRTARALCEAILPATEEIHAAFPGGITISTGIIQEVRRRVQLVSDIFGFGIDAGAEPDMRPAGWALPS
jgi:serine/threonine-protein kinase HipA